MNKKRLIGYLFVTMSVGCIRAQEQKSSVPEYKLWYDCPAQVWTEALPLGNGRLKLWYMEHQAQNKYN